MAEDARGDSRWPGGAVHGERSKAARTLLLLPTGERDEPAGGGPPGAAEPEAATGGGEEEAPRRWHGKHAARGRERLLPPAASRATITTRLSECVDAHAVWRESLYLCVVYTAVPSAYTAD